MQGEGVRCRVWEFRNQRFEEEREGAACAEKIERLFLRLTLSVNTKRPPVNSLLVKQLVPDARPSFQLKFWKPSRLFPPRLRRVRQAAACCSLADIYSCQQTCAILTNELPSSCSCPNPNRYRVSICMAVCKLANPLSIERGKYKTGRARFWHWLSGKKPLKVLITFPLGLAAGGCGGCLTGWGRKGL